MNWVSARGTVCRLTDFISTSAKENSFQQLNTWMIATVIRMGLQIGRMMRQSVLEKLEPSMAAASSREMGMLFT